MDARWEKGKRPPFQQADLDLLAVKLKGDLLCASASTSGSTRFARVPTQFSVGTLVMLLDVIRSKKGMSNIDELLDALHV